MGDPLSAGGIEAVGLSKRFGSILALDRVDLTIAPGESVVLFGPNGAGKTTLLRILSLSLRPGGGSLRVGGLDPRTDDRRIRASIGVVSHQSLLYEDLSPRQNLEFFARLHGVADPARRARELLETVGLGPRADHPVRALSAGLKQRASLARALVHDPPIVFLDEPFSGLDPHAADMLRTTLERLRREKRTVLLVTHNLTQGLELAERWVLLAGGRVLERGFSAQTDRAAFEPSYLERLARVARP